MRSILVISEVNMRSILVISQETSWEPVGNLMGTSGKPHKTQSNGRVNLNNRYIQASDVQGLDIHVCSTTPRFSYRPLKVRV